MKSTCNYNFPGCIGFEPTQKNKIDAKNYIETNCFDRKGSHISDKMHFYSLENIQFAPFNTHTLARERTHIRASDALIHISNHPYLSQNSLHCPMCHKLSSEKETPSVAIKMLSVTIHKWTTTNERTILTSGVRTPKSVQH